MSKKSHICPCCGYEGLDSPAYSEWNVKALTRGLEPPYSRYFGSPSYEVCDCCGYEFGNDDEPGTGEPISFEAYLEDWIDKGCVWFAPEKKPSNWKLSAQLKNIGIEMQLQPCSR